MTLFLDLDGEERSVAEGASITFGRDAELVVDADNRYLHRVLGCFVSHGEIWFLQNLGRFIPLRVDDAGSASFVQIEPGDQAPVGFEEFVVRFRAGTVDYRITGAMSEPTPLELGLVPASDTAEFGLASLNAEQRLLVLALGEGRLRGQPDWVVRMPANREVAARLGWTITKFNRKLDHLCRRLAESGVEGAFGDAGDLATNRRQVLVEHAVARRLVTAADLADLPPP
ncbi:MAG: hypothetical protein KGR17_11485 [Acidobacteria bacterium]|nr:hypothetical protein [Acidobacteriota bacterium]